MSDELRRRFGEIIRKKRAERGLSQEEFAEISGLHRTYLSDVELGKRNISLDNIANIALALDISISSLFEEVEREKFPRI